MAAASASETVKRAPMMKSVVGEEAIDPSPMKKQKLDDAGDDGGNISGKDTSDLESEWGYDSYDDDVYISDPDDRDFFKDDALFNDFKNYRRELLKGKGFVADKFNGIHPLYPEHLEQATKYICACINKYNRETGKTLEYVSTVKGNIRRGAKFVYYMTIMAREVPGGSPVEYQVKTVVYAGIWEKPLPVLCRPTLKPEN